MDKHNIVIKSPMLICIHSYEPNPLPITPVRLLTRPLIHPFMQASKPHQEPYPERRANVACKSSTSLRTSFLNKTGSTTYCGC